MRNLESDKIAYSEVMSGEQIEGVPTEIPVVNFRKSDLATLYNLPPEGLGLTGPEIAKIIGVSRAQPYRLLRDKGIQVRPTFIKVGQKRNADRESDTTMQNITEARFILEHPRFRYLTLRQQEILTYRYRLDGQRPRTHQEVGKALGNVSHQTIQKSESTAMKQLTEIRVNFYEEVN